MADAKKKKKAGKSVTLPENEVAAQSYSPEGEELRVKDYVSKRIAELKEHRKKKLPSIDRSIEDIWLDADREYQPHELVPAQSKGVLVANDDDPTRSRMVRLGQEDGWQSNSAAPDLYVKVNTALAVLVSQNPEATFIPQGRRFEAVNDLAYGIWKRSWEVSGARMQLKNFTFNLAKSGTGFLRTYPKVVRQKKRVRTEYYPEAPDKDVYEERDITKYDDLCRESLNPHAVWLSETARPGNYSSLGDWYHEKDYSWEQFCAEFGQYASHVFVGKGQKQEDGEDVTVEKHPDTVTVGFYENERTDLYAIFVPSSEVLLYFSPLPNDDGMLSLTWAIWTLRDDLCPYGIGLWEIIRNDAIMYDRFKNMTTDQITLAIYKMFFYKGANAVGDNGTLQVAPGKGVQVLDEKVTFLEVPGPGQDAWKGLDFLQESKDKNSGVTQQLSGQFDSKTLGQDVQAKESALERMQTPLDYICDALAQEAYITLSWQKQLLSTPEIVKFEDVDDLTAALLEMGLTADEIKQYINAHDDPTSAEGLLFQTDVPASDQNADPNAEPPQPQKFANVYRETSLNMEDDGKGNLMQSDEMKFFRFGLDLPTHMLDWKGIIRIKPQSVLAPSKGQTMRLKLDLFNLVNPATTLMLNDPKTIPFVFPQIEQIVKIYDENPKDWGLDKKKFMALYDEFNKPKDSPPDPPKLSVSMKFETLSPDVQAQMLEKYAGIKQALTVPADGSAPPPSAPLPDLLVDAPQPSPEAAQPQTLEPLVNRASVGGGQAMGDTAPQPPV